MAEEFAYQSCYCEENIWHLGNHPRFEGSDLKVVFISNRARCCAMWAVRGAKDPDQPVLWDYHVVLLERGPDHLWDLDHDAAMPRPAIHWLQASFKPVPHYLMPQFRVIDAPVFKQHFSSDRSHMQHPDGSWRAKPPSWPPIYNGTESNLFQWIDMTQAYHGEVMDLERFKNLIC